MREGVIVIPGRVAVAFGLGLLAVVAAVVLALQPDVRDAAGRWLDPRATADPASLERQRVAAEHGIQRGHAKALGQLGQVAKLTLAISAQQAASIDAKARADLKALRRDALGALGTRVGLTGPALEAYVSATEPQLDAGSFADESGILLAPDLFTIVARADELFQRTADDATRQLTRAPSPSPTGR